MALVKHTPVWVPGPLRVNAWGDTRPGFWCAHPLENGSGLCNGNVFSKEEVVGDHSCIVPDGVTHAGVK